MSDRVNKVASLRQNKSIFRDRKFDNPFTVFEIGWTEYTLFCKQCFFFKSAAVLLNFFMVELQILLRCCWTNVSTVKLRHFSYLLYLRLCLDEDLFMSYHCHLFLIFIFIFIMINLMILWTDMYVSLLVFYNMSYCFGW